MNILKSRISSWFVLLSLLAMLILEFWLATASVDPLAYSDFKLLLKAGKIAEVSVGDTAITGMLDTTGLQDLLPSPIAKPLQRPGQSQHAFVTARIDDPALLVDLDAAHVRYMGVADHRWIGTLLSWIVPAVVFGGMWLVIGRRFGRAAGGMLEIGKSKARIYLQQQTGASFADVAGIDEAKAELVEVVDFLKRPGRYRRLGGKIPKGVLLLGAPGTGKTLLARAVAGEAGVPFFSLSGSEFVELFVGVGAARVRDLFAQAEKRAPCIIFIDELDALGKSRAFNFSGGQDEREQTLNQLLVEMDGFDTNKGVIIMAATNRPEILDAALLRPGRFDRHIVLDRPDAVGREQILRLHARRITFARSVNLREVAARTPGFAGADLANLINEAALLAARHEKTAVDMDDMNQALDRIVGGLEKRNRVMNPLEKQTIAYHEAGHALVAERRPHADRVSRISIIPRGVAALGFTQQTPTEDRYLLRHSELLDRLDVLLGGRMAEEMVFGDVSTGAQNDLERATDMARQMVTQYGMSATLGPACLEPAGGQLLPTAPAQARPNHQYSENTAQAIDEEIRGILAKAGERVRATLLGDRDRLERLARLLLQKEVVDRAGLDALMAEVATAPGDADRMALCIGEP